MRIDRLELATSTDALEMHLHPRITVVKGLGPNERESLIGDVSAAIGWGRPGLSADLLDDSGRILLLQHPIGESARIVDALNGADVTDEFRVGSSVSIAGSLGVDREDLRRFLRVGAKATLADTRRDDLIRRLGRLDQDRLWAAALTLAEVEVEVARQGDEPADQEDYEHYIDAIEDCHIARERAAERLETTRSALLASSATLAILAFIAGIFLHPVATLPFLMLSVGCAGMSYWNYRELELATQAEVEVLSAAGVQSYFNLQLKQFEKFAGRAETRPGSVRLEDIHEFATQCWQEMVGVVPLEWAVAHRREIEAAARGRYNPGEDAPDASQMLDRIQRHLHRAGSGLGESVPAILDDPFGMLDDFDIAAVLTLIGDHACTGQVIILTDDPRVTGWAEQLSSRFAAALVDLGSPARARATRTRPQRPIPSAAVVWS